MKIIAETNDYLVINKPAGLVVHPVKQNVSKALPSLPSVSSGVNGDNGIDEATLTDDLLKSYPNIATVGDDPARPGIVHRLDKQVSGLMVIAKTDEMFAHLKNQFQNRTVTKRYLALAYGKISKDADEINFPIARSAKGYKMAAKPHNQEGRTARTEFSVHQRFINYTLLDVIITTGRTHQIRTHLAAYGHPIVGDDLYGTKKTRTKNEKLNLGRIFLHAYHLEFGDLQNERQTFTIELPMKLQNFLDSIHGK